MRALTADPSVSLVDEPDNEGQTVSAIWAKRRLGRYPVLMDDVEDERYRHLWDWATRGAPSTRRLVAAGWLLNGVPHAARARYYQGRWSPRMRVAGMLGAHPPLGRVATGPPGRLLVKSVHAPLALEWLTRTYDFDVLVLLRHPANVLASWIDLDLTDQFARVEDHPAIRRRIDSTSSSIPPRGDDPVGRMVGMIGLLTLALEEAAVRHPSWTVRVHEELCLDPLLQFRRLFEDLGLPWAVEVEEFLVANDRPGSGFAVSRVASDAPEAWKTRLTTEQVETLQRVLAGFPLTRWSAEDYVP